MTEPKRNEPGRNEPGRNEPGRNEPGRNEPGRNEPGRNELSSHSHAPAQHKPDEHKPTPDELGIDLAGCTWERSGEGDGSIEVAFPLGGDWARGDWVLIRVAGDQEARVLVFDRNEWECFIDGARNGEFNDAAEALQLG